MDRRSFVLALLALLAVCFALYANSLRASFQLDDVTSIVENPAVAVLDPGQWWSFWPTRFLTYGTFAVDHALHGSRVTGYHVTSILVHAWASTMVLWLAYGLLRRFFRPPESFLPALAAALLFAAHPLQTQAVTYVVQRAAALAAAFYLGSVAAYVHFLTRRDSGGRAGPYLALALALGALAQLSKEQALSLPAAILLTDLTVAGREGRWRRVAPFLPLVAVVPLLGALEQSFGVGGSGLTAQTERVSRWTYFLTQGEVMLRYLRLVVLPWGQNVDHEVAWRTSLATRGTWGLLLVHAAILAGTIWTFRAGHRLAAFAVAWFYLTLAPESSLFPILDPMFEHRVYLAMAGPAMALALVARRMAAFRPRLAVAAVAGLVVVLGALTVVRNRVWATPETLWRDAVAKSPGKARPHMGLGVAYGQAGRWREARHHLERAVALAPTSSQAWTNLGNVELSTGNFVAAARAYRKALEIRPEHVKAWHNLGVCLDRAGDVDGAGQAYEGALGEDPRYAPALLGLAGIRLKQGRSHEARQLLQRAEAAGQGSPRLRAAIDAALAKDPVRSP